MLRQVIAGIVFLILSSSSFAGVAITLLPPIPQPAQGYTPGQQIEIDVMALLTPGTPSVPGPGGTTTSIRVRMMQFDLSDSDAALDIQPVEHVYPAAGTVGFWDFNSTAACMSDDDSCGANYFIDVSVDHDDVLNTTYTGLSSSGYWMITLNQFAPKKIGELIVTYPLAPGTYLLDV